MTHDPAAPAQVLRSHPYASWPPPVSSLLDDLRATVFQSKSDLHYALEAWESADLPPLARAELAFRPGGVGGFVYRRYGRLMSMVRRAVVDGGLAAYQPAAAYLLSRTYIDYSADSVRFGTPTSSKGLRFVLSHGRLAPMLNVASSRPLQGQWVYAPHVETCDNRVCDEALTAHWRREGALPALVSDIPPRSERLAHCYWAMDAALRGDDASLGLLEGQMIPAAKYVDAWLPAETTYVPGCCGHVPFPGAAADDADELLRGSTPLSMLVHCSNKTHMAAMYGLTPDEVRGVGVTCMSDIDFIMGTDPRG